MEQQMASNQSLSLSEAIWQLPRQYIKVLCKPSVKTFVEEKGKASWGIVLFQFYVLVGITVALSYLAHFIPASALHSVTALQVGPAEPFKFLPSPYNGMAFILASFFIGLGTAYLFSKFSHGKGTFLAHTYCLLLCTVPLVTISGLLLLIPATSTLVVLLISLIFILFVYRMVLHAFTIMAVHELGGAQATFTVLIIPMIVVVIVLIVGLIFLSAGSLLDGLDFSGTGSKRKESEPRIK